MSVLKFIVTKQKLTEDGKPFVVENSVEYLTAEFDFSSAWTSCSKTAVFKKASGEAFSVLLDNKNSCVVPWEVIQCPSFTVSVYGICGIERITTNQVTIKVDISGYEEGQTPEDPTPTVYETILVELNDIKNNLGTAASRNVGINEGDVPILEQNGKLDVSVIPTEAFEDVRSDWNETDETKLSFIKNKPTSLSDFTDDLGENPTHTHSQYISAETDPTVPSWAKAESKPTYDYSEIQNKPTIPTDLTDLGGTLPISQGGTGATTEVEALSNLGAQAATDNSLNTTSKTVVGAINELYDTIGTLNDSLEVVLNGN